MESALYHPTHGYYRRKAQRVGRAAGTDFYTSSSLGGGVFGRLLIEAAVGMLPPGRAQHTTWVEIGAESPGGVLAGLDHPFADTRTLRIGDPLVIPHQAVVFSNELWDAQPFRRLRWTGTGWRECGIQVRAGFPLREVEGPVAVPVEGLVLTAEERAQMPVGYTLDFPQAAHRLLRSIASQSWAGAWIAADYGLSVATLLRERPHGTARAYIQHRQENDLYHCPGERDLTCHVGWDWLENELKQQGFQDTCVERQEAFFMRRSLNTLTAWIHPQSAALSHERQTLKELLHPGNLGSKFQFLSGVRR